MLRQGLASVAGAACRRARMLPALVVAGLALSCGFLSAAAEMDVLQPASVTYTAEQQARLAAGTRELEGVLGDAALASRVRWGERGWGSQEFAAFSAGALAQLGYATAAVAAGTGGEERVWILVRVDLGGAEAWVPVETSPSAGASQDKLGFVPWAAGGGYDERYTRYDRVLDLAPNQPPVAAVRFPLLASSSGGTVSFTAMTSRDPDGEIILYVWSVDGSPPVAMTKTWTYEHSFAESGAHTVTVTVVDNRGARAIATATFEIYTAADGGTHVGSGCGCGGG